MSIKKIKNNKNLEDIYYPVPQDCNLIKKERAPCNQAVVRRIIQGAIKIAYRLKNPDQYDWHGNSIAAKAIATNDQIEMVMHLIESLQPMDAIEAALASQFAITYISALEEKDYNGTPSINLDLFEFGHKVLEVLQKYRSRGAQQICVQYNVNNGQVMNIKAFKKEKKDIILNDIENAENQT
jgi:hypothetical protein